MCVSVLTLMRRFLYVEFGATELNSTLETSPVLLPCNCRVKLFDFDTAVKRRLKRAETSSPFSLASPSSLLKFPIERSCVEGRQCMKGRSYMQSVKIEPRSTSRLSSTLFILSLFYLRALTYVAKNASVEINLYTRLREKIKEAPQ